MIHEHVVCVFWFGFALLGESVDEVSFFRTLRADIGKISDFFVKEQLKYSEMVKQIEAQFECFLHVRLVISSEKMCMYVMIHCWRCHAVYRYDSKKQQRQVVMTPRRPMSWGPVLHCSKNCSCWKILPWSILVAFPRYLSSIEITRCMIRMIQCGLSIMLRTSTTRPTYIVVECATTGITDFSRSRNIQRIV